MARTKRTGLVERAATIGSETMVIFSVGREDGTHTKFGERPKTEVEVFAGTQQCLVVAAEVLPQLFGDSARSGTDRHAEELFDALTLKACSARE